MINTIVATIYEMVEDSQQRCSHQPYHNDVTSDQFYTPPTTSTPDKLNHVVVARLSSSVLLHRDYASAVFKRSTFERRTTAIGTHNVTPNTTTNNDCPTSFHSFNKPTPAVYFAQSNSFLDEGDNILEHKNVCHPINQPRQCSNDDVECWDNLEFLYAMLIHAIENLTPTECNQWLDCLELDSHAFDDACGARSNNKRHSRDESSKSNDSSDGSAVESNQEETDDRGVGLGLGTLSIAVTVTVTNVTKHPLIPLLNVLLGVVVGSEASIERTCAKNVLSALFDRSRDLGGISAILRTMICSEIAAIASGERHLNVDNAVDDREMLHVNDLLDLLFQIVATFPTPLHSRHHHPILLRVMVSLHKSTGFSCITNRMIPVVLHLMKKGGPLLTKQYLRSIVRVSASFSSPRSERAFITEVLELLQHVVSEHQLLGRSGGGSRNSGGSRNDRNVLSECIELIFTCVGQSLRSMHFEVVYHVSNAFTENQIVLNLLKNIPTRKLYLPIVINALLDNHHYWHDGVRARCHDLMNAFAAMDKVLVRNAVRAHQSNNRIVERRRRHDGGGGNSGGGGKEKDGWNVGRGRNETDGWNVGRDDEESVSSEMYASSEYSSVSYTSSEYTNSSTDSPRIMPSADAVPAVSETTNKIGTPKLPKLPTSNVPHASNASSDADAAKGEHNQTEMKGKVKTKTKKHKKKKKKKHKTRTPPTTPPPTPPTTPVRQVRSNGSVPHLSPSFVTMRTDVNDLRALPSPKKSTQWRSPSNAKRNGRSQKHKHGRNKPPKPSKWTTHEGKKKRLAWGTSGGAGGGGVGRGGGVLARAKLKASASVAVTVPPPSVAWEEPSV